MRKLVLEEWITLDGYAEDGNGKLDYFPSAEENRYADEQQLKFLDTIDTILLGRKTYELFVDYWPTATTSEEMIADKLNGIPKVVFSNTLTSAPWGKWSPATVSSGDAIDAIKKIKSLPGKDLILWGSISLAQDLMKADLIDLYKIRICPTLSGSGRALFPSFSEYQRLKLVEYTAYNNGLLALTFTK